MSATAMRERPIPFSDGMVVQVLDRMKVQTRRVFRRQPPRSVTDIIRNGLDHVSAYGNRSAIKPSEFSARCPYGQPGDRLWIRETWGIGCAGGRYVDPCLNFRADGEQRPILRIGGTFTVNGMAVDPDQLLRIPDGWRSSRFMPRWASRLLLEIVSVRAERVDAISREDAIAEGMPTQSPMTRFAELWDSLNAKRGYGWRSSPWVWVLTFKRIQETP